MKMTKLCDCTIVLMLIICAMSCMRKDNEPLPLQSRTVMTVTDADPAMVIEGDTILTWIGANGENRITGLVDGKGSGISIEFGYLMKIFVSNINIYRNGKLNKLIDLSNIHPVYEESDSTMVIYDKHGKPATDKPTQLQYDYFHETWRFITSYE